MISYSTFDATTLSISIPQLNSLSQSSRCGSKEGSPRQALFGHAVRSTRPAHRDLPRRGRRASDCCEEPREVDGFAPDFGNHNYELDGAPTGATRG